METVELAAELGAISDDSVDAGAEVEFWGSDWRVHLVREEVVAADDAEEMRRLAEACDALCWPTH